MKRKDFLIGASLLPAFSLTDIATGKKKKSFSIAHITDIHVKPGAEPENGMAKALQSVQASRPDFIVNTGDCIMDALEADKAKTTTQWNLFNTIMKAENKLPVYSCIGNHDIWGWFNKDEQLKQDKVYGKQWAVNELQLPGRYYHIEKNNWAFIFLDSTQLNPAGGYIANLDSQQMEWLSSLLNTLTAKNVCIFSHIPILSICAGLFFNKTQPDGDLLIKRNLMHTDFFQLNSIFFKHKNIRACISGHIHMQDDIMYAGIRYLCNGAISGNWWHGSFNGFEPAYAMLDFFDDGSIIRKMIQY
ncbi:MAG: metallophosphoesterase [Rhizobacter sp.]|nr:metallophosphoesterase [Ferruginibacter sp.]